MFDELLEKFSVINVRNSAHFNDAHTSELIGKLRSAYSPPMTMKS